MLFPVNSISRHMMNLIPASPYLKCRYDEDDSLIKYIATELRVNKRRTIKMRLNFLRHINTSNLLAKRIQSMAFGFAFILNKTEAVKSTTTEKEAKKALIVI